jgi:hypothetical protein
MSPDPITSWSTFALAVFSLVALLVAYLGIKSQAESLAKSVSADLCLKMVDRFDSPEMRIKRNSAAEALLSGTDLSATDEVFDFFEILGLYLRKKMLDPELVHSMFFHWINLYWRASNEYIATRRERAEIIYSEFERLHRAVLEIEMKTCPRSRDINPTADEIKKFLEEELTSD